MGLCKPVRQGLTEDLKKISKASKQDSGEHFGVSGFKKEMKIEATGNDDSTPFNRLPDEIVLHILNKVIDLKTLCICYVVCKRFCSIVVQIGTISFTTPPIVCDCEDGVPSPAAIKDCIQSESFNSVGKSVRKFTELKSLSMRLSFSIQEKHNRHTIKWKSKFSNNTVNSFLFISPASIYRCNTDSNTSNSNSNGNVQDDENEQEEYRELRKKIPLIAHKCLMDAIMRFSVITLGFVASFPLLENVSITDSAKMGTVSLNAAKVAEMRRLLLSQSNEDMLNNDMINLSRVSFCYTPLLELPVSRYVMKGVTLILMDMDDIADGHDNFLNIFEDMDAFEDKEEVAAYNEALMEILKKHKGRMMTF